MIYFFFSCTKTKEYAKKNCWYWVANIPYEKEKIQLKIKSKLLFIDPKKIFVLSKRPTAYSLLLSTVYLDASFEIEQLTEPKK